MSLLRNKAAALASCEFIYLMDVDYLFDEQLSDSCIEELKNGTFFQKNMAGKYETQIFSKTLAQKKSFVKFIEH